MGYSHFPDHVNWSLTTGCRLMSKPRHVLWGWSDMKNFLTFIYLSSGDTVDIIQDLRLGLMIAQFTKTKQGLSKKGLSHVIRIVLVDNHI